MSAVFYHAAHADGKFIRLCSHRHGTVSSAYECRSSAEEYVVAIENGVLRALTRTEERESPLLYAESDSSRCAVSSENAGTQMAMYSVASSGVE